MLEFVKAKLVFLYFLKNENDQQKRDYNEYKQKMKAKTNELKRKM